MPINIPPPLDDAIAADYAALCGEQAAIVRARSRYCQQLRLPSTATSGGKPSDESVELSSRCPMAHGLTYERTVTEYQSARGPGFVVTYHFSIGQRDYAVSYNQGPEGHRERPVTEVVDDA